MTQPASDTAVAERERPEVVFGVSEDILNDLSAVPTDYAELPASAFDGKPFTLVGYSQQKGGEKRISETDGKEFETSDQWLLHWRAEDPEIAAMLSDNQGVTTQRLNLPKSHVGSNGVAQRSRATRMSQSGLFVAALDNLGISSNSQQGHALVMKSWADLIGITFIRERRAYPMSRGTNARVMELDVPIAIVGVDDNLRKELKLPAIKVNYESAGEALNV